MEEPSYVGSDISGKISSSHEEVLVYHLPTLQRVVEITQDTYETPIQRVREDGGGSEGNEDLPIFFE